MDTPATNLFRLLSEENIKSINVRFYLNTGMLLSVPWYEVPDGEYDVELTVSDLVVVGDTIVLRMMNESEDYFRVMKIVNDDSIRVPAEDELVGSDIAGLTIVVKQIIKLGEPVKESDDKLVECLNDWYK